MTGDRGEGVVGVLLAGGLARRMGGGDKCLRPLGRRTILDYVVERARGQTATMVLNANGDPARFDAYGLPVAGDVIEGAAGPLAGVLTGMEWARAHRPDCPWIATFATDTPFFPLEFVSRSLERIEEHGADMARAASGGRAHPVFGLWPVRLRDSLDAAMRQDGVRKVDIWTARYRLVEAEFATEPFDPFFNANSPEDLAEAARLAAKLGDSPPAL
ncbi:MAG: molybdenum cofactor guanylyltransferase MobA [Proteobacteria bacterium]|nr:molybdenum cofactor guanylyltransferase MobA [Pseudomonadota bacterium]